MMGLGFWVIAIIYLAATAIAYHLFIVQWRNFNREVLGKDYVTNGDVLFSAFMAAMPVGLPVALAITAIEGYGPAWRKWAKSRYRDEKPPSNVTKIGRK
jgi:hypothetical protein